MGQVKVVRPGDQRHIVRGAGDEYAYLAVGQETDGRYFMMEAVVPPGGGPPPHVQTKEEEAFYVLEGTVTFWAEGEQVEAGPGTFLHIPSGASHNFRNESHTVARMLILFAPAGIEVMFGEMSRNPDDYVEIAKRHGVLFE